MVDAASCVVVAQPQRRMRPLPDLGRLSLECSTGTNAAKAARDAVVANNDLLVLILTARTSADACELAAAWCAAHRDACADPKIWPMLTQSAFVSKGIRVKTLTEAHLQMGYSPKQWFVELCDRFRMRRAAQRHIDDLKRRQKQAAEETRRLESEMKAAAAEAMFAEDVRKRLAFRAAMDRYESARLNMEDPVHPGVRLSDQLHDARLLLAAANRALKADPFDARARRVLDRSWQHVFTPTSLPPMLPSTDSENSDDDDDPTLGGFIVTDPEAP